jgi:magnesium-protoporphyrin O-methyltransferase
MSCPHCQGLESLFNQRQARNDLKAYRKRGPSKATGILLVALRAAGIEGATLLDIGGGVGVIQLDLMHAGVARAVDVDASTAYLAAAREEAERAGFGSQVTYQHGDFVELAPTIDMADIVTLDRVVCCYPDMPALVGLSAARARRLYGVIYPRDAWWTRWGAAAVNLAMRVRRVPYRFYVHAPSAVGAQAQSAGLEPHFRRVLGVWQVEVFRRMQAAPA